MFQFAQLLWVHEQTNKKYPIKIPIDNELLIRGRFNPSICDIDAYGLDLHKCFTLPIDLFDSKETILAKIEHNYQQSSTQVFDLVPEQVEDNTNFSGYFQNIKFIQPIKDILRTVLKFNPYVRAQTNIILDNINKQYHDPEICAVHIRRGDGVMDNGRFQVLLDIEYYKERIKEVLESNPQMVFVIVSDDIKWCKEQFDSLGGTFVYPNSNDNPNKITSQYIDMCLISKCDSIIMSNSSFSWWGAFLSNSEYIYVPDKWWGTDNKHICENLYMPEWNKCKTIGLGI